MKYTDDDDKPVQAQVDIPMAATAESSKDSGESDRLLPRINIYDEENAVFIGPMFIIHRSLQRSLSLKISL